MPSPEGTKRAKLDDESAALILAHKADTARAQIRGLLNSLPDIEAKAFLDLLDNPPKDEDEEEFVGRSWDDFPPEVKNMIYRYVFVSDGPVKPDIRWPNMPDRRFIVKHRLGAGFLRCSKTIFAEGRTILRGENTFDIGPHFRVCLGGLRNNDNENANLIRKAMIQSRKISWNVMSGIHSLEQLTDLTIVADYGYSIQPNKEEAEESVATAFRSVDYRIKSRITGSGAGWHPKFPKAVFFVGDREIKTSDKKGPDRIAFRFKVTPNTLRRGSNGRVEGEEDLWQVGQFDLQLVARNEYRGYSLYPRV